MGIELGMDAVDGSGVVVGVPLLGAVLAGAKVAEETVVLEAPATMSHDCVGVYASFPLDVARSSFPEELSVEELSLEKLSLEDVLNVRT